MDIKHIIKKSKALLKERGHTVTSVCKAAGIPYSTISRIENGERQTMSMLVACKLELASPNGEFKCEELSPETFEAYRQVIKKRALVANNGS